MVRDYCWRERRRAHNLNSFSCFVDDRKFETVAEEEEEEEEDGEFIPSSWNSNAKPSRSAMKSPDKSSSVIIF